MKASPISPVQRVNPSSSGPEHHAGDNPNTTITPTGLATTDTVLGYCAQIDRNSAPTYQTGMMMITQGHSDAEISGVRMDPEYAKTRNAINAQLSKVPFGSGLLGCQQFSGAPHRPYGVATPVHTQQFGSY